MYSRSLSTTCRHQCWNYRNYITKQYINGNNYQYLLLSNHHYHICITTKYKYDSHNSFYIKFNKQQSIRSFATNNKKEEEKEQHDDSYLDIDDDKEKDESGQDPLQRRKWKSSQSTKERQIIDKDLHSTSEKDKPSKWSSIKTVVNKPFAFVKNKMSRKKKTDGTENEQQTKKIQKEKMVARPGKKSLPAPDQGVMTFIPKHKAQILNILQEECNIFPDEVFPLFPDNKTEEILAGMLYHFIIGNL